MADDRPSIVDDLRAALEKARRLAHAFGTDPLRDRLLRAFERMPEGDRETVVGVLEYEVDARLVAQQAGGELTNIALRPNPNARLYLRVIGPEPPGDVVEPLAVLRAAARVQQLIDVLDPAWRSMIAMALRQMDPQARGRIDRFNRDIRALLDEASAGEPPANGDPVPPTAPPHAPESPEAAATPRK